MYLVQTHTRENSEITKKKHRSRDKRGHRTTDEVDEYYDDDEKPKVIKRLPKLKNLVEIPSLIEDDVLYEGIKDVEENVVIDRNVFPIVVDDLSSLVIKRELRKRREKKVNLSNGTII